MRVMMKRSHANSSAGTGRIALAAIAIAAAASLANPSQVKAQSADLVLCDRVAADPSDPDKPADVKGTPDVAPSDVATAIKYCRIAASSSRRALYQLGRAYAASGQTGDARDEEQARKLFERAAQAGNPRGVTNLAALGGGGTSSDLAQARELLAKAAETNAEAQYQLGLMLAEGTGGAKDDAGARALFEKG